MSDVTRADSHDKNSEDETNQAELTSDSLSLDSIYEGSIDHQIDKNDPFVWLQAASERLSQVRYVFLVQIEEGIASASQRASLEYSDAVLMGWPDKNADDVENIDQTQLAEVIKIFDQLENRVAKFRSTEREDDVEGMGNALIRISESVAQIRQFFQPDFLLPTFAEIRRVVDEEWNEDMSKIDSPHLTSETLNSDIDVLSVDSPQSSEEK